MKKGHSNEKPCPVCKDIDFYYVSMGNYIDCEAINKFEDGSAEYLVECKACHVTRVLESENILGDWYRKPKKKTKKKLKKSHWRS